jgi:hypothetical protein
MSDDPATLDSDDSGHGFGMSAAVEVFLGIGENVKGMHSRLTSMAKSLRYLRKSAPVPDSRGADGVVNEAGNPLLLDIGVPTQGTYWSVRKIVVGGLDIAALVDSDWVPLTVDGFAGVYVSGAISEVALKNPGNFNNLEDIASQFPGVAYYPKDALTVRPQEHLYVVVYGGTSGQQYVANANITIHSDAFPEAGE